VMVNAFAPIKSFCQLAVHFLEECFRYCVNDYVLCYAMSAFLLSWTRFVCILVKLLWVITGWISFLYLELSLYLCLLICFFVYLSTARHHLNFMISVSFVPFSMCITILYIKMLNSNGKIILPCLKSWMKPFWFIAVRYCTIIALHIIQLWNCSWQYTFLLWLLQSCRADGDNDEVYTSSFPGAFIFSIFFKLFLPPAYFVYIIFVIFSCTYNRLFYPYITFNCSWYFLTLYTSLSSNFYLFIFIATLLNFSFYYIYILL
jgi:hypothetical protein